MKNSTIIISFVAVIAIGLFGYLWFFPNVLVYSMMGPAGLHNYMIGTRNYGIQMAQQRGDYRCCIEPPCTMCYSEANQWNNFQAGTCACDDLIAKGEEPCPQCAKAISCDSEQEGAINCDIKGSGHPN